MVQKEEMKMKRGEKMKRRGMRDSSAKR